MLFPTLIAASPFVYIIPYLWYFVNEKNTFAMWQFKRFPATYPDTEEPYQHPGN